MQKLLSGYIRGTMIAAAVMLIAGMTACRKEVPPYMKYDADTAGQSFGGAKLKKRKVLLIGIDGAPGKLVESFHPTAMTGLLPQSVYTFDGLADTVSTVAAGWTSVVTGFGYPTHQIGDSTLIPKSVEGSHADIKYYNSFIHYLKEDDINTKVTAITPWEDLGNFIFNTADKVIETKRSDGDKAVADAAINELTNLDPDVVLANFIQPAVVGLQSGFNDNPAYHQTITDIDGYIGKMLDALKARKQAGNEDWLVIIQSTSGGDNKKMGGKTFEQRNTFTIFYSPLITPAKVTAPAMLNNAVRFHGGASNFVRAVNNDGGLYNVGNGSMTIEAKVKFNLGVNNDYTMYYPPFLTKCISRGDNTNLAGWSLVRNGEKILFYLADGNQRVEVSAATAILDGTFHTVTATAAYNNDPVKGNTYTIGVYVDGAGKSTATMENALAKIESASPLVMGYNPDIQYDELDMYMADVHIWNTVLTDDIIKKDAGIAGVAADHPNYKNLIGYWSCQETGSSRFKDMSPSKQDFLLEGSYSWDFLGIPLYAGDPAITINDVTPSILNWIGITLQGENKPAGKNWLQVIGVK
ncbi:uncharacterized protein DUF4983 [Chitinophaga niastensis]|uniref:Uncharacterized protein DUF4983 n=1 Tax=Chitinophaga niastensis TaxID=536980 RepID=A0A2P8HJ63_CHINA|nr:LamG-like jellyroll fold domain-containing protein [Chitinophaga niastensis]PSL46245.1 uncharacterized protein DUF4983 [Chitinophaga niastensis]